MKAAFRDRYGSPDVVQVRDVVRPEPGDRQVLVRVRAASVNRADLDGLTPKPSFARLFMGLRAPRSHSVGIDIAGVVESVGFGATRLKPGDEVFRDMLIGGQGGFAEYVCAPERRLPKGRTIKPGDRVLIDGVGHVGPFAVQIAKSMGAEVTGPARRAMT